MRRPSRSSKPRIPDTACSHNAEPSMGVSCSAPMPPIQVARATTSHRNSGTSFSSRTMFAKTTKKGVAMITSTEANRRGSRRRYRRFRVAMAPAGPGGKSRSSQGEDTVGAPLPALGRGVVRARSSCRDHNQAIATSSTRARARRNAANPDRPDARSAGRVQAQPMGVQPAAPPTSSTVSQFGPRSNIPRPNSGTPQLIAIRPSRSTTYRRSRLLRAASQCDRAVTRIRPASIPVNNPRTVDAIPAIASSGSVAQPITKPQQTKRVKTPGRVNRSETNRGTTRSRDRSGNNTRRCGDTESSMAKNNTDPKVHTSTRTAPAVSIKGERTSGRNLK